MSEITTIGNLDFKRDGSGCHVLKDGCPIGYIMPCGTYRTDEIEPEDIDALSDMVKTVKGWQEQEQ